MNELVVINRLWWGTAGVGAVYAVLFALARRPVALRSGSLAWMLLAVFAVRLGLLAMGYPLETWTDVSLTGVTLSGAVGARLSARVWLVRAAPEELRQQIQTACLGLFLACEEPMQGRFLLTAKRSTCRLQVLKMGRRLQLVVLPRSIANGKVALLLNWLSKQYPGPVPRIRIVLKRSKS